MNIAEKFPTAFLNMLDNFDIPPSQISVINSINDNLHHAQFFRFLFVSDISTHSTAYKIELSPAIPP